MASTWEGAKVRLRAVEPPDWEQFFAWDHDSETARRAYFIPFPRSVEATRRWAELSANEAPVNDVFRFAVETLEQELVGTLNTHDCDRRQGTFSYGVAIGAEYRHDLLYGLTAGEFAERDVPTHPDGAGR
jgi:RimJ/RimL family protein N-acetyltransferase